MARWCIVWIYWLGCTSIFRVLCIPGVELRMDTDISLYMGSGCFLLTISYWGVMVIDYEKFDPSVF